MVDYGKIYKSFIGFFMFVFKCFQITPALALNCRYFVKLTFRRKVVCLIPSISGLDISVFLSLFFIIHYFHYKFKFYGICK